MFELEEFVGKNVSLVSPVTGGQKFTAKLVEYFRNNTLLVSMPENIARSTIEQVGKCFQLRFVRDNVTFSYHTKVVRICNEPYLCLQLLLPENRDHGELGRDVRLPLEKKEIRVVLQNGGAHIPVSLADISLNGARLVSGIRLGRVNEILNIELSIELDGGRVKLPCRVRYVRTEIGATSGTEPSSYHHGVEFLQLSDNVENFLLRFVS